MLVADFSQLAPGTGIDGFTLLQRLHEGRMASVWRVSHPDHPQPLVMKIPAFARGDPVSSLVGFELEQMILPLLGGPHVPGFVANGALDVLPYLVMEQIEGRDLRDWLDRTPIALEPLAALGAAIATALHDLHRQHVVHLDLKPSNLLLRPDGRVVVIDFGLACHEEVPDLLSDHFRQPLGSAPYLAPEQVLGVRGDPRSDLFALGVLLYTLATGERPFGYPHSLAGLRRRLWRPPLPPRRLNPSLPSWFQEIVLRLLEVEPAARYQSGSQLAFDLRHPEAVPLTARAELRDRPGLVVQARRWWQSLSWRPQAPAHGTSAPGAAPVILVAVSLTPVPAGNPERWFERTVRRIVSAHQELRVVCLNVITAQVHQHDQSAYYARFVELSAWSHALGLGPGRVTCLVLTADDPAQAIVDYCAAHPIDHLVIGDAARGRGGLGPVALRVLQAADCTVTVVRRRHPGRPGDVPGEGLIGAGSGPPPAAVRPAPDRRRC